MIKTLKSGLKVEDTRFYELLDWKDKNSGEFLYFASHNSFSSYSLNLLTREEYDLLDVHVKSLNTH